MNNQLLVPPNESESSLREKLRHSPVASKTATFKNGLATRVHRWFRLTPSFGPDLVQQMLDKLSHPISEPVLDPFAGASTTLIECQLAGIPSLGFEINPFLHFVGKTSLNWGLSADRLEAVLIQLKSKFASLHSKLKVEDLGTPPLLIPPIHDPLRWWRPDVLKDLLIVKSVLASIENQDEQDFFALALAGVLVPDLTNVTLGRLQLHFVDKSEDDINVWRTYETHSSSMIADLRALTDEDPPIQAQLSLIDSTNLKALDFKGKVHSVVTSPPYPNRYSYVWNTRPHLYLFDFFSNAKEASELDKQTIGGTWGSATSVLMKGEIQPQFQIIKDVISPIANKIRSVDPLMANYVMKYFNLLGKQIVEMDPLLVSNAGVAYVVGCSWLKEVYIETDVLLGQIFEGLGLKYKVTSIDRIRFRNSGKELYESIVYARKGF